MNLNNVYLVYLFKILFVIRMCSKCGPSRINSWVFHYIFLFSVICNLMRNPFP